ncbi:MAG: B12-binding domain-containing radical SAM protein [Syntrophaceae bacterium]|nr:B12-binding domain-containing radical SAM protein [Syntrophaceae bacterium]
MSKILLIKPRFYLPEFYTITQPMGLMYIGAVLRKAGHEVKIHDCGSDCRDLRVLRRTITRWKPDFIGVSIIVTELEQTREIMRIIRGILPDVPVTFGGPWPSANPGESLKTFGADFVVIGEGELVFPELVEALNKGLPTESIAGTASVVDGRIKINPGRYLTEDELNALPFPAWDLLDHKLYAKMPSGAVVGCRHYMAIVTSRGCPFQCAYCHRTMGKIFRKRTAQSVLAEMEELRFRYGFKEFEIIDDCFNVDRERMYAVLTGIQNRLCGVKLHFANGLRADMLEPEDMLFFKQAGTVSVSFAIETSSPRLQKMIHKNLNIDKAILAINAAVDVGIYTSGFFMIGFPTESYEEASATVDFAVRSVLHRAAFYLVTPFAGTELAKMAAQNINDAVSPKKMTFYYTNTLNISSMSDSDLRKVIRHAYLRFYFNYKRLLNLVIYHPQFFQLPRYAFLTLFKILPLGRRTV